MGHFNPVFLLLLLEARICHQKIQNELNFCLNNIQLPPAVAISVVGALRISTQLARPTVSVHNTRPKTTDAPGILNFEIQAEFLRGYFYGT